MNDRDLKRDLERDLRAAGESTELHTPDTELRRDHEAHQKIEALFDLIRGPQDDAGPADGESLEPGTQLGEFTIVRPLGSGGMGQVFLARQESLDRDVAIKVCKVSSARDSHLRGRFESEGRTLAQLKHPNVVPVLSTGEDRGHLYIAMEYVSGASLAEILYAIRNAPADATASKVVADALAAPRGAVDKNETGRQATIDRDYRNWVVQTLQKVAEGLGAIHDAGIVHRDIKPANLVLDADGNPRIVDFGLARAEMDPSVTVSGDFLGTPAYTSPEQARGRATEVSPATDVFSFGVMLFECLTLQRPFDRDSSPEILGAIIGDDAPFLRKIDKRSPWELEAITDRCLRKEADDRYPSANDLARDLKNYQELRPIAAKRATVVRRASRYIRRRPRAVACGFAALMVLLAAGLWAWDYNRLQVTYYANVTSRWGVPEGVGPIDAETQSGRRLHYRIASSRRMVRSVRRVNSFGTPIEEGDEHAAASYEISYREDGSLQQIDLSDRNGKLVMRQEFSELRDSPEGPVHFVEFKQEHRDAPLALNSTMGILNARGNPLASGKSEITVHRIQYRSDGRKSQVTYLNAYRVNRANAQGVFGQRYTYSDGPLPARTENLGPDGNGQTAKRGLLAFEQYHNALGDVTEQNYLGLEYRPILLKGGYYQVTQAYDAQTNLVEQAYFGVDGQPIISKFGYHKLTRAYNNRGSPTDQAYFGIDGVPVVLSDGFHKRTSDYDERGNLVGQACFGADGEPALHKRGYHKFTRTFDADGNPIEWAYFGVDGESVLSILGYHKSVRAYDARSKRVGEEAFFGVDDRPVLHRNGYHKLTSAFDDRDDKIEEAYFGVDGMPVLVKEGVHRTTWVYDQRGNRIEYAYFGVDDEPVRHKNGYHKWAWTYDDRGNVIGVACFGVDGQPTLQKTSGYHGFTRTYDERGNPIRETYFGVDNEPLLGKNGIHKVTWAYDDRDNQIEEAFFGLDGEPVVRRKSIVHKYTYAYDERGNMIEAAHFGIDGEPIPQPRSGIHKVTWAHNARGNVTELAYFGVDGKPTADQGHGHHKVVSDRDRRGQRSAEAYFGVDGEPVLTALGIHKSIKYYDERGNLTGEAHFGINDEPILHKNGHHKFSQVYDDRGNRVETAYFGVDGESVLVQDTYHKLTKTYDSRGNWIGDAYFGIDDEPILHKLFAYHQTRWAYDGRGNTIERAYFGLDGQPILLKSGYHKTTLAYDERGNQIGQAYFDADGGPILIGKGYHQFTRAYDERGNLFAIAFFGIDGQPVLNESGYHNLTLAFDARGNAIERAYFGVDGQPIPVDGFVAKRHKYDHLDHLIATEGVQPDGQVVPLPLR